MPTLTQSNPKRRSGGKHEQSEIADEMKHYRTLRWFAVISMLAIVSWLLIDLFGPIPKYTLKGNLAGELNSLEFLNELEALAGTHADPQTHVEALPNGANFYETELKAIRAARKSINWEAYIFAKGEIARQIVDALTEQARAGVEVNLVIDAVGSLTTPKNFFTELRRAGGRVAWYHPLRWYNWPNPVWKRCRNGSVDPSGNAGWNGWAG